MGVTGFWLGSPWKNSLFDIVYFSKNLKFSKLRKSVITDYFSDIQKNFVNLYVIISHTVMSLTSDAIVGT